MEARKLLQTARVGEAVICRRWRKLWGKYRVCVTGRKRVDGELLILISNEPSSEMIAEYRRRWQIETLFGCLKSRGFDLEQTHLQESERLEKLLGLLALAICWSWLAGEKLSQSKPFATKRHGRGAKSIFRLGLDHLEQVFRSGLSLTKSKEGTAFTLILSCT
ncbi:MAG TPA: transposase [Pyrinomonadaceae bacterium]|nr:transposase [Pyrinomonadaceae bacterium]